MEFTNEQKEAMNAYQKQFIDRLNDQDIIQFFGLEKSKKSGYNCPLCNSGRGPHGTGAEVTKDHRRITCFAWEHFGTRKGKRSSGDILAVLQALSPGKSINDILKEQFADYDIRNALQNTPEATRNTPETPKAEAYANTPDKKENDYTGYFKACSERLNNSTEALNYLSFRGISKETANRFMLGFDNINGNPFIVIPTTASSYTARNILPNSNYRYRKTGAVHSFNIKELERDNNQPIFIVEGEIDALSVIEAGSRAIGLGSTNQATAFIEAVEQSQPQTPFILCLDNDEPGQRASKQIKEALESLKMPVITANICGQYKDPNEALTKAKTSFLAAIKRAEEHTARASKPDNITDYLDNVFARDIQKLEQYTEIKTGFANLDEKIGSLYPGLYTIGAVSSLGKTTFTHQIADQIAESGHDVLFFSLEQSRFELASKSIARKTAQIDQKTASSALSIRKGNLTQEVLKAYEEYKEAVKDRLSIIEGNFETNIDTIKTTVDRYIQQNRVKPVVVVDYLQVIQNNPEKKVTTREAIDIIVTELKRLSRDKDIAVIVISSLNRTNYLSPIDFESFKESGGIEYTSDVVWGLQLQVMNEAIFDKDKSIKEKRERIRQAKAERCRKIEFVCLKNRYGISSFKIGFNYYPEFDLFEVDDKYLEGQSAEVRRF